MKTMIVVNPKSLSVSTHGSDDFICVKYSSGDREAIVFFSFFKIYSVFLHLIIVFPVRVGKSDCYDNKRQSFLSYKSAF